MNDVEYIVNCIICEAVENIEEHFNKHLPDKVLDEVIHTITNSLLDKELPR